MTFLKQRYLLVVGGLLMAFVSLLLKLLTAVFAAGLGVIGNTSAHLCHRNVSSTVFLGCDCGVLIRWEFC